MIIPSATDSDIRDLLKLGLSAGEIAFAVGVNERVAAAWIADVMEKWQCQRAA